MIYYGRAGAHVAGVRINNEGYLYWSAIGALWGSRGYSRGIYIERIDLIFSFADLMVTTKSVSHAEMILDIGCHFRIIVPYPQVRDPPRIVEALVFRGLR